MTAGCILVRFFRELNLKYFYREHLVLFLGPPVFPPLPSFLNLRSASVSLKNYDSEVVRKINEFLHYYLASQYLGPGLLMSVLHEDTLAVEGSW